jgi:hypothetical protein
VVVTGFDDRSGCGYVLRTGDDLTGDPEAHTVVHEGRRVTATAELAAMLADALAHRPVVRLRWGGPEVPLTLDDPTVLSWVREVVGGVLTVCGGPDAG